MARYDVGYSAAAWGPNDFLPALNDIASAGFTGVEIGTDIVQIFEGREDEFLNLMELVDLKLAAVCATFMLTDPAYLESDLVIANQAVEFLKRVSGDAVLVAIPAEFEGARADGVQRAAWSLVKIGEFAARAGVKISVKPHRGGALFSGREMSALMDQTGALADRITICLDTAHLQMSGTDPRRFLAELGHRIGHVQLTDLGGERRAGKSPVVDPGTGELDLPGVLSALRSSVYHGWIVGRTDSPRVHPRESAKACSRYYHKALHLPIREGGAGG